jgi:hypothetical protein
MSRRKSILLAIKERLEAIRIEDGFRTNAGANVALNEAPRFGAEPGDPQIGIAIIVGLEAIESQSSKHVAIRLPINVQAIALADLDAPWESVEDVIADIKQAVEHDDDLTLGGLVPTELERGPTQTLEREPGSEFTGAELTFVAPFKERRGQPDA